MNNNILEKLCKEALDEILSVKLLNPDRIKFLFRKYVDLNNENKYTPNGKIGDFFHLFIVIMDLYSYVENLEIVKTALKEYSELDNHKKETIIKWLIKYEVVGVNLNRIKYKSTLQNWDEIPDGSVLLHPEFDVRVLVAPFIPILDFLMTFDDLYYTTIEKYRSDTDEETYFENGVEFYKSNHQQKRLLDFVKHIINPPIEDVFVGSENPLDFNQLKRHVPIKIEYHSFSSLSDKKIQKAHDFFHQDEFEKSRALYKDFLQSRNDSQEAWLGLTICNFILGDYEKAYISSSNLYTWRYRDLINYIEKYKKDSGEVNEQEYYILDRTCDEVLLNFNNVTDHSAWLNEHKPLFNSISIQPKNFPSVANCNYEGKYYQNISDFHTLYKRIEYEELELKTHYEAVLYFIRTMNIHKLDEYLIKKTYASMPKTRFFNELKGVFDAFKASGDSILYTEPGVCQGCQIGCGGFIFVGNKSSNYIELIIKTDADKIVDFFECTKFKNDTFVKSMLGKRIEFDPNECPF